MTDTVESSTGADLVRRYLSSYAQLRAAVLARALALWDIKGGLSDSNADRFVAAVAPVVWGGQIAVARLVAGYVASLVREMTGTGEPAAIDPRAVTTEALRGVPTDEVYRRAVVVARTAVAAGKARAEAMATARVRAGQLAETDVVLAQRQAATSAMSADSRIVGYRRVLTGRSCALCATASTQRYRSDELMPIHGRCDCGVVPILGSADPGRVINSRLVADLKTSAATAGDPQYWRSRHLVVDGDGTVRLPDITIRRHGELGPVVAHKGHKFTGPGDIAA